MISVPYVRQVLVLPLAIFVILIATIEWQVMVAGEQFRSNEREKLTAHLNNVRARLEQDLTSAIFFSKGLDSFIISQQGQFDQQTIQAWLENMYSQTDYMINIGVAPGNRIEIIHPIEGNEAALGLYYPDLESQWPAIKTIIDSRESALVGPINLVQGGQGLIYRSPIYLTNGYWGITSIVLDSDKLLSSLMQVSNFPNSQIQLINANNDVLAGQNFSEEGELQKLVTLEIPGADWRLKGTRINSISDTNRNVRSGTYPVAFIAALLVGLLARSRFQAKIATTALKDENERVQKEFVSVISHELRTPLTAAQGAIALMSASPANDFPAEQQPLLEISKRNIGYLSILINNLLDLDRLTRNELTVEAETVHIYPIVRLVCTIMDQEAKTKNLNLVITTSNEMTVVRGDAERIKQMLQQLLSNAIKFSPMNAEIRVHLEQREKSACIAISDHGPGIDDDIQPIIFQRFRQGKTGNTRSSEGAGIGLALVHEIIALMDGSVAYKTSSEGSTFYLTLPLNSQPPLESELPQDSEPTDGQ